MIFFISLFSQLKRPGLAPVEAPSGFFIAYATEPGGRALDGLGSRNSPFTSSLLKYIKKPNLEIHQLFNQVRAVTEKETDSHQIPWSSSSLNGKFFFDPLPHKVSLKLDRTALVIGVGDYYEAPLINPVNDAIDIADTLQELGFEVSLHLNPDNESMRASIRTFIRNLQHGGVGLFFYAGHGVQFNGNNYLIPSEADIDIVADLYNNSYPLNEIIANMVTAENRVNVIILDTCRDNPYYR